MSSTRFYKDGDNMAIVTTAEDEREFINQVSDAFAGLIESKRFESDWDLQLKSWLPQVIDIACKMRGYKADVEEKKMIIAGSFTETASHLVIEHDGRKPVLNGVAAD